MKLMKESNSFLKGLAMTREDQIKKAAEIIAYGCSDELKAALIQDFPELRESEDERIRTELIEFLDSVWHLGKNANFDKWGKADCAKWIDYLERQKEPTFISDLPPDDKGEPGENGILEKQKEQKPIQPNIEREYIEKRLLGLTDKEGEYYRGAREELAHLFYILGGNPSPYLINNVAKEEQKPAEWKDRPAGWNEEKEAKYQHEMSYIPKPEKPAERFAEAREEYEVEWSGKEVVDIDHWSGGDDAMLESILSDINYATPPHKKGNDEYIRKIAWVKSLRPQPKQEWSEEDEKIVSNIVSVLGQYIDYKAVSGTGSGYATPRYSKEIDWLKSLRPQPKQEWDDDDYVCFSEIVSLIRQHYRGKNIERGNELINWFKGYEPQPSWKPSEKQMNELEYAISRYRDFPEREHEQKVLKSLYNDLKKLI